MKVGCLEKESGIVENTSPLVNRFIAEFCKLSKTSSITHFYLHVEIFGSKKSGLFSLSYYRSYLQS